MESVGHEYFLVLEHIVKFLKAILMILKQVPSIHLNEFMLSVPLVVPSTCTLRLIL